MSGTARATAATAVAAVLLLALVTPTCVSALRTLPKATALPARSTTRLLVVRTPAPTRIPVTSTEITKAETVRKITLVTKRATPARTEVTAGYVSSTSPPPKFMAVPPKLDRAHKSKLLVEAPCGKNCSSIVWEVKEASERTWRRADAEVHASFPDTFYVRSLRPDTAYVLRALLRQADGTLYAGDDVPTLDVRTCPEKPPPVGVLRAHSSGPGWLEVRWTPPPKETCKSHLFYQARYAPHGAYFSPWRTYGFFRNDRWVHFRPTHPCAVWPAEFCLLLTDGVRPGEQHVVEVRVSRFDELTTTVSDSRKVVVRADTACVAADACGVIGGAPASSADAAPAAPAAPGASTPSAATPAADEVDVDDADARVGTGAPAAAGDETMGTSSQISVTGDTTLSRLAPVFLALLVLTSIALPAAFFWGKRRGAQEAVDLHLVPGWRRRCGDGGSQPVLVEEVEEERGMSAGSALQVDQHGRYSWAKLLPNES